MSLTFSFGDCELDEQAFELRRGKRKVDLQPKVLELLFFLVRNRERVISKQEFMDALWSDATVGDGSLARCMSILRQAIGDTDRRDGVIRTIARHGYRFCAPTIERLPAAPVEALGDAQRSAVGPAAEWPFVGRDSTKGLLQRAAVSAQAGRPQLVALSGPPGIGKSRMIDWFHAHVRSIGGGIASGRCLEGDGAGAFWPWHQLLRSLRECLRQGACTTSPTAELRAIARLIPALSPDSSASASHNRSAGRFRLFQDIVELFERASARFAGPIALSIDDLHRADAGSLMLLRYVVHELGSGRIVLLLALQDSIELLGDPLTDALTDLRRAETFQGERLPAFGSDELARLVELRLGRGPDAALVAALLERTEGNPFLVREVLRWLEREGLQHDSTLPESIELPGARALFEPRLRMLSKDCRNLLDLASVIGREFAWSTLTGATPPSTVDLLDALDEAERADLLVPTAGGMRYRFVHGQIRDLIYKELTGLRRASLHRAVGEALERQLGAKREILLPELAHHFFHASRVTDPQRALHYAVASAEQAQASFAHEAAAEQYGRALDLVELCEPGNAERRLALLLALGDASKDSGDTRRRREAFHAAADVARSLQSADCLARAALGYCGSGEWRLADRTASALLQESLDALGGGSSALRARILARLAHAPELGTDAAQLAQRALDAAHDSRNAEALCEAQHALHFVLETPEGWAQRRSVSEQILATGAQARRSDLLLEIRLERMADRLIGGDRAGAEVELDEARALATQSQHPWARWLVQVSSTGLALLRGDFVGVEASIQSALSLGQRVHNPWSVPFFMAQTFFWRRQCGPLDVLGALLRGALPAAGGWSSSLVRVAPAALSADLGDASAVRRELERIAADGFSRIPRDRDWLASMAELAAVCAHVGDKEHGAELEELLAPHADQQVVLPYVICYGGPVARVLALLAIARRDDRAARRHFEASLASATALGSEPWHARLAAAYGTYRLHRAGSRRDAAALELVRTGEDRARQLGIECAIRSEQQRIAFIVER